MESVETFMGNGYQSPPEPIQYIFNPPALEPIEPKVYPFFNISKENKMALSSPKFHVSHNQKKQMKK